MKLRTPPIGEDLFRGDRVKILRDNGAWVEIQKEDGASVVESAYLLAGDELIQVRL